MSAQSSLVLTLVGPDRPGLVEAVSKIIVRHGANWLESRMVRLAGKFAGVLLIEVPPAGADALAAALSGLADQGLKIVIEPSVEAEGPPMSHVLRLELTGHDRPGIVSQISHVLAERGVNVEELTTGRSSAPMSGEPLFHAEVWLLAPVDLCLAELTGALEGLANDLMVDITLVPVNAEPKAARSKPRGLAG
ncbi:glycine cleavage system protein R [Myxococcota bacterium]